LLPNYESAYIFGIENKGDRKAKNVVLKVPTPCKVVLFIDNDRKVIDALRTVFIGSIRPSQTVMGELWTKDPWKGDDLRMLITHDQGSATLEPVTFAFGFSAFLVSIVETFDSDPFYALIIILGLIFLIYICISLLKDIRNA
jgi:hypothetical protein